MLYLIGYRASSLILANAVLLLFVFVLFSSQFKYKLKKLQMCLGIEPAAVCRVVGADGSTELWVPQNSACFKDPICSQGLYRFFRICTFRNVCLSSKTYELKNKVLVL